MNVANFGNMLQIAPFWHAESEYALDCQQGFKVLWSEWRHDLYLGLFESQSQLRPIETNKKFE